MTTTQLNENSSFARLTAAILFVLMVGMGYAVSPQVEGAVDSPIQVEERDTVEAPYPAAGCAAGGLVLSHCALNF